MDGPYPDADGEWCEEDVVADLGVGVLDGDGVGREHDGGGKVHHGPPVVGGVVPGDAEMGRGRSNPGLRNQELNLLDLFCPWNCEKN